MIREEWERTFDAIPDLIAILDEEHNVTRVNQAMANTLNISPESCIGIKCFKAVHSSTCPPDFCPHSKLLKDGKEHTSEVYEKIWVDISLLPYHQSMMRKERSLGVFMLLGILLIVEK